MAFPIAQLVIGLKKEGDCTINDKIPLFLIVSGGCGIAAALLQIMDQLCCNDGTDGNGESKSPFKLPSLSVFSLLLDTPIAHIHTAPTNNIRLSDSSTSFGDFSLKERPRSRGD